LAGVASSALWALGFAIGVVGWAALGWVIVHGVRTLTTALAAQADAARELRLAEEPAPVAEPVEVPLALDERLAA
jgi:hypothetical protein